MPYEYQISMKKGQAPENRHIAPIWATLDAMLESMELREMYPEPQLVMAVSALAIVQQLEAMTEVLDRIASTLNRLDNLGTISCVTEVGPIAEWK